VNLPWMKPKKCQFQLNAGALPVPIKIIEQRNIGATLGTESIQKSIQAGFVGLLMVVGFMTVLLWTIGGYCRFCFNYLWFSYSGFI
jgi:Preprotein translocase subunit SecD